MFVCQECSTKTGWTFFGVVSVGPCELCERVRECDDLKGVRPAAPGSLDAIRAERDARKRERKVRFVAEYMAMCDVNAGIGQFDSMPEGAKEDYLHDAENAVRACEEWDLGRRALTDIRASAEATP